MALLEWDASRYDSLPLPHVRWGRGVVERLAPRPDATVVDLGCGTGRDTELLLDLLPDGRVIAVDGSERMLERGRFEAEFGGRGNVAAFGRAVERAGGPAEAGPWGFPGVEETIAALEAAGFTGVDVRLVPDPVVLEPGAQLEAFIATVLLGATLRDMRPEEGARLVHRIAEELDEPVIDSVRLQLSAVRG